MCVQSASAIADWPVVNALLESGANPRSLAGSGWDTLQYAALLGRPRNVEGWCNYFQAQKDKGGASWDINRREQIAGMSALCLAAVVGVNVIPVVQALVAGGADTHYYLHTGTNILHNISLNIDATESDIEYILSLPGVKDLVDVPMRARTFKWKIRFVAARLLVRLGSKKEKLKAVASWKGQTPLCCASRNGNIGGIKLLIVNGGANRRLKNVYGDTALDQARQFAGENLHADSATLLSGP